jgi:hypothetical protein
VTTFDIFSAAVAMSSTENKQSIAEPAGTRLKPLKKTIAHQSEIMLHFAHRTSTL